MGNFVSSVFGIISGDPAPPPIQQAPKAESPEIQDDEDEARRKLLRARTNRSGTLLTGLSGDTSQAPVQRKTLLGE